jgi:succinyl-diaminopimelate desuccinylase
MNGDPAGRLAARTLELVDVASESRYEEAILRRIVELVPGRFGLADEGDATLLFLPVPRRRGVPLVLLAGHVDTVPAAGAPPGRIQGGAVVGRGASDMKGALAVMLEIAEDVRALDASDLDLGLLFVGREELPIGESALGPLLGRCRALEDVDLAVVMEPTANAIEVGCMGNLNVTLRTRGRAAHSARPWQGANAAHALIRALSSLVDLPVRDVEIDGLVFREVVSVTRISGGDARNVVPGTAEAEVNVRYAPTHTPADAEARLRELLASQDVEVEVVGNAPPAPVRVRHPLVERLRVAGGLDVRPKQAWTPVAELAAAGIDAVNFGPGDPQYAHRDDERVEVAALVRSLEIVRGFLAGPAEEDA